MPHLPHDQLKALLERIYAAAGVSPGSAEIVSRHQINADLAGHDSHGVMRTPDYVALIERGDVVPDAPFEVVQQGPSTAVIDANWNLGFVATERAMNLACDTAATQGVATVTVRRQGHIGRLGAYTGQAAERGMIAMLTADSGRAPKSVAPFGGREARLGTNPISLAIPSRDHGPIVMDMATSTVAGGKVKVAASRGDTLPPGWIIDRDGHASQDPQAYLDGGALLPLGADQGHKGYGLSFMVEVLSGLLTGIGFGVYPDGVHNDGVFMSVFDVARFRPADEFEAEVSDFVRYLKDTPLAAGASEILHPGELESRTAATRRSGGIPVGEAIWDRVVAEADRLSVDVDVDPV